MYVYASFDIFVLQMIDCHTPVRPRIQVWKLLEASMKTPVSCKPLHKMLHGSFSILSSPNTKIELRTLHMVGKFPISQLHF